MHSSMHLLARGGHYRGHNGTAVAFVMAADQEGHGLASAPGL